MTQKKILIVNGSPRKQGNSTVLASRVQSGALESGAHVDLVELHEMVIQPCSACESCQLAQEDECIIEDDMQTLYPKLRQADVLVIVSPIYWFTVSAQTKLFIDRGFYALGGPDGWSALGQKEFAVLLVYGDSDPLSSGVANAIHTFQDIFRYIGANDHHFLHASASEAGEIAKNQVVLKEAFEIGKRLGCDVAVA